MGKSLALGFEMLSTFPKRMFVSEVTVMTNIVPLAEEPMTEEADGVAATSVTLVAPFVAGGKTAEKVAIKIVYPLFGELRAAEAPIPDGGRVGGCGECLEAVTADGQLKSVIRLGPDLVIISRRFLYII